VKRLVVPGLQLVHVDGSVQGRRRLVPSNPAVAYAEPNYLYHADAVPNDPRYPQLWGLAKISAPAAWNITTGSTAVTVGVVDTGSRPTTSTFGERRPGPRLRPGRQRPAVTSTATARTSPGRSERAVTTAAASPGVNWQVGLMPVRVLDGNGSGSNANVTPASPTRARTARAS
jgi:thermitase